MSRKPFTGILNIIRFNWHFYAISFPAIIACIIFSRYLPNVLSLIISLLALAGAAVILTSLIVSWYIYDHSNLYSLTWIDELSLPAPGMIANINAGFDETSILLKDKYPSAQLEVYDFYDANKHTEISIERARKAYPAYNGTMKINTVNAELRNKYDIIFLILAVHEIRNNNERTEFFRQLANALNPGGRIVVVEHQRDFVNFIAFNIGFLHFHSPKTWLMNFVNAGLKVIETKKLTPFLNIYNLSVN